MTGPSLTRQEFSVDAGARHHTEKHLGSLLQKVTHLLTPADLTEATEYLAAREYGLALETIAAGLIERHDGIHAGIVTQVEALADAMHLSRRRFVQDIHAQALRAS